MLSLIIFIASFFISIKTGRLITFLIFGSIVSFMLLSWLISGFDAAFQISDKVSDTKIYYHGYIDSYKNVDSYIFSEYPIFLKVLTYPFVNSTLALLAQSYLIFILINLLLIRKKYDFYVLFLCSNHALIYTVSNLFKDNLFLVVALSGAIVIGHIRSIHLRAVVVGASILLLSSVRPFFRFFFPATVGVYLIEARGVFRGALLLALLVLGGYVIYVNYDLFSSVINSFRQSDSSAQSGFSFLTPVKIFFGPTPTHYLLHDYLFEQPMLNAHSVMLFVLHWFYYLGASVFLSFIKLDSFKSKLTSTSYFLLFVSGVLFLVYSVIYGSADVRHRAIIIVCFTIAVSRLVKVRQRANKTVLVLSLSFFLLLDFISALTAGL